jgi:hypothetical protein
MMHTHGLVDLRLIDPTDHTPPAERLNAHERRWGNYVTTRYHTWQRAT